MDPETAQRAKDASLVRSFIEKIEKQCASLAEVSAILGTDHANMQHFEQVLRERFGYTDPAVIERLYVSTDFWDDGGVSKFELAHLFSAPALTRNLLKQLKGRNKNCFVMFCKLSDGGAISKAAFEKFLTGELRYQNAELVDYLFCLLDLDGNRTISYEEFEKFWTEVKPDKAGRKSHRRISSYWLREGVDQLPASAREPLQVSSRRASKGTGPVRRRRPSDPSCSESRGCKSWPSETGSDHKVIDTVSSSQN